MLRVWYWWNNLSMSDLNEHSGITINLHPCTHKIPSHCAHNIWYTCIHFLYDRMQHTKLKPLNCLQSNAICINHQWNDCIVSLNLIELNYSRLQSYGIVLFVENKKKRYICSFFYPKYICHSCLSRLNESNCGFSRIKSNKLYDSMIFILFIMSSMMIVDTHCMKEIFQWNEHCGWE